MNAVLIKKVINNKLPLKSRWLRSIQNRWLLFLLIFATIVGISLVLRYFLSNQEEEPTISCYKELKDGGMINDKLTTTKYILIWSPMWGSRTWYMAPKNHDSMCSDYFEKLSCPSTNCIITSNHKLMKEDEFDAILFTVVEHSANDVSYPTSRSPKQKFIAATQESPINVFLQFENFYNYFNWTMNYRLDSDVLWNYGSFIDVHTGNQIAPAVDPQWKPIEHHFENQTLLEIAMGKTKMIAWFVSHCNAESYRDDLVREMQKYVPVDVYGHCPQSQWHCQDPESCYNMLRTYYKFYLAFENSLCQDYVTEKLYNMYDHDILPIVYGGANYTRFAPPKSYIDANDFETVQKLVEYLKYLDENPKEYIKYFWWKSYYKVNIAVNPFCNLCKRLNEPESSTSVQYYNNIRFWWHNNVCFIPKIKF